MHKKRITFINPSISLLCVGFVMSIIVLYLFLLRVLYSEKFDRKFFNDLYDHSQYNIAQSYRAIGDSAVYQVVGDRLVNNVSKVFQVDPQVPPLGKLIIGYSIKIFGNAYVQNIFVFVGLLIGVWLLGIQVLHSKMKALAFTLLVLFDPIIVSQLKTVMLDLMSATFIVWLVNLQLLARKKMYGKWSLFIVLNLLSGVTMGLLASVKFGLLMPFLIMAVVLSYIISDINNKEDLIKALIAVRWKIICLLAFLLLIGFITGFFAGHYKYFLEENANLIDFLKNEKWVITYWLIGADTGKNYLMIIVSLISGFYKHFTSGSNWEWAFESWNPIWILGIVGWIIYVGTSFRDEAKFDFERLYVMFTFSSIIFVYSIVSFYYRYIVHISPLVLLGLFQIPSDSFIRRKKIFNIIIPLFLAILFFKNIFLFYEQPRDAVYDFERFSKLKLYKDLYEKLEPKSRPPVGYEQFWDAIYTAESGLGRHEISLLQLNKPGVIMPWHSMVVIPYRKIYTTEHGNITHNFDLILVRKGHKLNILWSNEYVYKDYDFGAKFEVSKDEDIIYGKVYDKSRKVVASRQEKLFVYIKPDFIDDEQSVIDFFETNMGMSQFELESIYKVNFPRHLNAEIGLLPNNYIEKQKLPSGVIIENKEIWVGVPRDVDQETLGKQGAKVYFIKSDGTKKLILEDRSVQGSDVYL